MTRWTRALTRCFALLGISWPDAVVQRWCKAAEQGDADAQFNLGAAYREGDGVPKDAAEAVRWYRLAAEQGHAGAQGSLGVAYQNGEGVPRDP